MDKTVEAKGLEPSNLLTASQALYQLSYAPERNLQNTRRLHKARRWDAIVGGDTTADLASCDGTGL